MGTAATFLGYGLMILVAIGAAGLAAIYAVALWPVRFDFHRRDKLVGRLVSGERGPGNNLNLIVGVSSRGRVGWFFGLMTFAPNSEPPRWPTVVSEKRRAWPEQPTPAVPVADYEQKPARSVEDAEHLK